jgi:V/A-type H+-transporting ATPase subunit E
MIDEPDIAPEEGIIEKIASDGEAEARRVVENARRSERSEKRKAEAEAAGIREDVVGKAEAKAAALRSKVIAIGHIEAKRMMLGAREEAVGKVFETIEQELEKVRKSPAEYRKALANLAVEAVSAIGESEVTLKLGDVDRDLADGELMGEITRRAAERAGREVSITLETDSSITSGGCVAVSTDGRINFDNSFARRLERMKPELRSLIVREVLKTDA